MKQAVQIIRFYSVVLSIVFVLSGFSYAEDLDVDVLQEKIFSTIAKSSESAVWITGGGAGCSGVIISEDGLVLSAGHAIRPGVRYRVRTADGRLFSGRGMGSSMQLDIALLKINEPNDLAIAPLGDSDKLVVNQPCVSLAYPAGQGSQKPVVRFGRITRVRTRQGMVQTTAVMEPGDSGGPLFDLNGQVIGIHSRIAQDASRNFDIPINVFKENWQPLNRAQWFTTAEDARIPKIGFVGENREQRDGVTVISLVEDGAAKDHGLEVDDVISSINGRRISSLLTVRRQMRSALEDGQDVISVIVKREGEAQELTIPLVIPDETNFPFPAQPSVEYPNPRSVEALADLPEYFSELESKLDDNCLNVRSKFGSNASAVRGTIIRNSDLLVSKNSLVGDDPYTIVKGEKVNFEVIERDTRNDLVLLKSPRVFRKGIQLEDLTATNNVELGRFLLAPNPTGDGIISVCSAGEFESRRSESRGFLGVVLSRQPVAGGAMIDQVNEGAADRAGLQAGDLVKQVNDRTIQSNNDLVTYLRQFDPNDRVKLVYERDDVKTEKWITLGDPETPANHAADMMDKSGRRDGFTAVISHDADLDPNHCGGPVFDLQGNFIGINIARNSRVRSYTLPGSLIQPLVEKHLDSNN